MLPSYHTEKFSTRCKNQNKERIMAIGFKKKSSLKSKKCPKYSKFLV